MITKSYVHALLLSLFVPLARAAFTKPTESKTGNSWVEQNAAGTWCYYPQGNNEDVDVACVGRKAELEPYLRAHLNQTISIAHYTAGLVFLGGPEWPVDRSAGDVGICLSGRAGDGRYKTYCQLVVRDNDFGLTNSCALEIGQDVVTDGCYVPGLGLEENPPRPSSGAFDGGSGSGSGSSNSNSGSGSGSGNGNAGASSARANLPHLGLFATVLVITMGRSVLY